MEILTFIAVVILIINSFNIKKQLSKLTGEEKPAVPQQQATLQENRITPEQLITENNELLGETRSTTPEPHKPDVSPITQEQHPIAEVPPHMQEYAQGEPSAFEKRFSEFLGWLKEDWLAKSGGIILLIGVGWFVSYAFAENWIGEQGRIAIGLVVGALMLVFGYFRMRKSSLQGGLFLILGSTTILMTIWAARTMYDMFPPAIALAIMFLSVAFVSVVAVLYKKQSLATVALLLALLSPLLTNSSEPSFGGLMSYLLVVVVGTTWIVVKTGWKSLLLISLIGVFLFSLPFSFDVSRDIAGVALLYAFIFSGLFTIVANRTLMRSGKPPSRIDLSIVSGVGLYLLTWIQAAAPAHWESMLYAAWAAAFAGVGYVVFRITKDIKNFLVYAAISLVYIVLATVATFDGPLLIIALSIEAGLIPVLVYKFTNRKEFLINFSLLQIGPALLSFDSFLSREWRSEVPFDHFAVLLVVGCALFSLGLYTYQKGKELMDERTAHWGLGVALFGVLYFLGLIWLVPQGIFAPNFDVGRLVSLVLYTFIGVVTYVMGHVKDSAPTRLVGGFLAGLVILRLLFVEVWDMQASTRIITFLMVGVLLIATAFIEKKNKD